MAVRASVMIAVIVIGVVLAAVALALVFAMFMVVILLGKRRSAFGSVCLGRGFEVRGYDFC